MPLGLILSSGVPKKPWVPSGLDAVFFIACRPAKSFVVGCSGVISSPEVRSMWRLIPGCPSGLFRSPAGTLLKASTTFWRSNGWWFSNQSTSTKTSLCIGSASSPGAARSKSAEPSPFVSMPLFSQSSHKLSWSSSGFNGSPLPPPHAGPNSEVESNLFVAVALTNGCGICPGNVLRNSPFGFISFDITVIR